MVPFLLRNFDPFDTKMVLGTFVEEFLPFSEMVPFFVDDFWPFSEMVLFLLTIFDPFLKWYLFIFGIVTLF